MIMFEGREMRVFASKFDADLYAFGEAEARWFQAARDGLVRLERA